MTSRLFWKLFLAFAVVHLVAVYASRRIATRPAPPGHLQLYAIEDGRESELPLKSDDGSDITVELAANGTYDLNLQRTNPDSEGTPAQSTLSPGQYRLAIVPPDPPKLDALWTLGWSVVAVLFAATLWLVAGVVRPVRKLTAAADQMAAGQYDDPIYVANRDELGKLAASFNRMRQKTGGNLTKMRDTNRRMATVLGGMTDGVIAIDDNIQVLFANRAAGEFLDFAPAEAQGKTLLETVRSHTLQDLVVGLLASHGHRELELDWDGNQPRNLLVSATSFSGESSAGIVMMIYNLTEERRLESMRRDFVANVSHELKTPLSSIKAYAETLSQGAIEDAENRGHFVRQIEEQADRLNQLISDLLSLARIEQGQDQAETTQIPLTQAVERCVQEQQRAASEKNIRVVIQPSADGIVVRADEDGLRQILINLIDNAIKYTPPDGEVSVGWTGDHDRVALFVADTGIGIPEDMKPRVFERFFRVDKARSREVGGTGLGLAIVKHLAQSYGGSVEVESEVGKGSKFTVFFPIPVFTG